MSHGEIELQPSISEYAKYIKTLIPVNIPRTYALKSMFKDIANEENIRNGVVAFRDFLYLFCDRLMSDGHAYCKPKKTKNPDAYPFLHNMNDLLIDIGYHGQLAENGDSLLVTELPSCTAVVDENGKKTGPKISFSGQMECLRFLSLCGFIFTGVDLEAKAFHLSQVQKLEISYLDNPNVLMGLKTLAIAAMELKVRFVNNAENILRCDYRVIKAEDTDVIDVLKDILHPLPQKIKKFALELHQRYVDMGMICVTIYDNTSHFAYAYIKNRKRILSPRDIYQQRVWAFTVSMKYGYSLMVRAKKTDKYMDVIEKFPSYLQEKIAQGYGCDRKLRNERCQGGCQGIRIPLDDAIVKMKEDIETWLDHEVPCSMRK